MRNLEVIAMKLLNPYPTVYKLVGGLYRIHQKIDILTRVKFAIEYRIFPFLLKVLKNKNMKEILELKDTCKGKRCFIIATGPSVLEKDIKKMKDEILIGVNSSITLCRTCDIVLDYYLASDMGIRELFGTELNEGGAKNIFHEMSWLKFRRDMLYSPFWYSVYAKGVLWIPSKDSNYKVTVKHMEIPKDFMKGFCVSRTISFLAMQLAVLLGFSEIYLYGFDHSYAGQGHFNENRFEKAKDYDTSDDKKNERFFLHCQACYEVMKKYCEEHNIAIYNATRGGHLEVFERIDFDHIDFNTKDNI